MFECINIYYFCITCIVKIHLHSSEKYLYVVEFIFNDKTGEQIFQRYMIYIKIFYCIFINNTRLYDILVTAL